MKILGMELGIGGKAGKGDQSAKKPKANLQAEAKHQLQKAQALALHYQVSIIALVVAGLLALTALKMLSYTNPPVNDNQVQLNLAKFKQTHIDPKVVQKIKQLQNSGTSTSPDLQNGRTNPFSE